MAKAHVHISILHLCVVAIYCGRSERLEKRLKGIQTLLFQDMQSVIEGIDKNALKIERLKESVDNNTLKTESLKESVDENSLKTESLKEIVDENILKMDSLADLINKRLSRFTHTTVPTAESKHDVVPTTEFERNKENNFMSAYSDVKRLQKAFQEHKMHSLSLQVNILAQLEKTISDNKDAFIKITSESLGDLKFQIKAELDDMRSHMEKLALMIPTDQVNVAPTSLSCVECNSILSKAVEILTEVNRSRHIILDSILALKIPQQDKSDQILASCFKIEDSGEKDVSDVNDHQCIDINTRPGTKFTYHCDNRNIRIGDAIVTEVGVEGRVEVRYNNHWGTVCRDSFDDVDATVACKMAGFARGVEKGHVSGGSGQIWLDDLRCEGYEMDLFDCDRPRDVGGHNCGHHEDAEVRCFWLA